MAGGLPTGLEFSNGISIGAVTSQSAGTTITSSGGVANSKQAWVQLVSSTANDADWIQVSIGVASNNFTNYALVDIGVGASGSQQVIFSNLSCVRNNSTPLDTYALPCSIPAGSTVWARAQWDNSASTDVMFVSALLAQSSLGTGFAGSVVDTYGIQTTSSPYTTQITLPTSDNTLSAWTSIASPSTDLRGFSLHVDFGGGNSYNGPFWFGLINIGVGASGSQAVALSNIPFLACSPTSGIPGITPSVLGYYPIPIANGTNIWLQAQVKDYFASGATPRIIGVSFHGVRG